MVALLGEVLRPEEALALREAADGLDFADGRATAGPFARDVKNNEQARAGAALEAMLAKARAALEGHAMFQSLARPRRFVRMMVSRYGPGMAYGTHVDDALMAGARTDLSFTLFLSPPDTYEGGGLTISDEVEDRNFRPEAGDALLYPTSALHRVEPVTRGERLAVVGWVQSWVREPARREVLHDLEVAAREVFAAQGKTPAFDRLQKARSNLLRMWADG